MRIETVTVWIFVGLCLLTIGALLYMLEIPEGSELGSFLTVMGLVYFAIGGTLLLRHDRHMVKRMRAGRDSHR